MHVIRERPLQTLYTIMLNKQSKWFSQRNCTTTAILVTVTTAAGLELAIEQAAGDNFLNPDRSSSTGLPLSNLYKIN